MILYFSMIQQVVDPQVIEQAWQINPYNGLAYGALVILLAYIAWKADKERRLERDASIKLAKDTVSLITKVEEKMPGMAALSDVKVLMDNLKRDHSQILGELKSLREMKEPDGSSNS